MQAKPSVKEKGNTLSNRNQSLFVHGCIFCNTFT